MHERTLRVYCPGVNRHALSDIEEAADYRRRAVERVVLRRAAQRELRRFLVVRYSAVVEPVTRAVCRALAEINSVFERLDRLRNAARQAAAVAAAQRQLTERRIIFQLERHRAVRRLQVFHSCEYRRVHCQQRFVDRVDALRHCICCKGQRVSVRERELRRLGRIPVLHFRVVVYFIVCCARAQRRKDKTVCGAALAVPNHCAGSPRSVLQSRGVCRRQRVVAAFVRRRH